ncbi:class I SAM-dependent methyltransferase [Prochlorococcus sp. AH-716-K03]|nr:class I SAM-dependent methyltransferase [Prochlorococcus sp. AH-716-K03]|tara:strand:- start:2829 stop:3800 length:972 start_codon:yes stop_codon:yes gene_type:complete
MRDFKKPIIKDNRKLREEIPSIEKHFKSIEKEVIKYPKVDGLIKDPNIVTFRSCPICESKKQNQLFTKLGFMFVRCPCCNHHFIHNPINEEVLLNMYEVKESDNLQRVTNKTNFYKEYWKEVYSKYVEYFQTKGLHEGSVLDIGSGTGAFLEFLKNNFNYKLYGTEFADEVIEDLVKIVGKKENIFHKVKIEDINFNNKKFDVITMWGVLEHVYNPLQVLEKISSIISSNGIMLALIPNLNSRALKILGITTPTLDPRGHIHYFTDESINKAASLTGMKVIDKFGELPVIDLMHQYLSKDDNLINQIIDNEECYYSIYILSKH